MAKRKKSRSKLQQNVDSNESTKSPGTQNPHQPTYVEQESTQWSTTHQEVEPNTFIQAPYAAEVTQPPNVNQPTYPGIQPELLNPVIENSPISTLSFSLGNASFFQNRPANEQVLLNKFRTEVLENEAASRTLKSLQPETQEKYLYQIRRYISHCANKGLDNFYVTYSLVKELIEVEIEKRGQITENTIKSLRSSINKLYHMNRIVYSIQQPYLVLGDNIVQEIMSTHKDKVQSIKQSSSGKGSSSSSSTPLTSRSNTLKELSETNTEATIFSSLTKTSFEKDNDNENDLEDLDGDIVAASSGVDAFRLSESSKTKLTEAEEYLLKKFNQEVLESENVSTILSSLTPNTFKSYATDMKRFIRFCARHGKTDSVIDEDILNKFLALSVDKSKKSNSKKLRTSLLKLHQLNCEAYNLDYSEGDIVFLINKYLDSSGNQDEYLPPTDTGNQMDLIAKLEEMYISTNEFDGFTEANKILHKNEFKRYALFCSGQGLQHFHVTGETVTQFFITEIVSQDSNIPVKKLRKILKRLLILHKLNAEIFVDYPLVVEGLETVEEFLTSHKTRPGFNPSGSSSTEAASSSSGGTGANTYSGATSSISSLTANVPPLFFNDQGGTGNLLSSEQASGSSGGDNFKDNPAHVRLPLSNEALENEMLQLEPIPPFEKVDKSSKAIGGHIEESGDDDDDDDDDDNVVDVHASEFPPAVNLNPEDDSENKDEEESEESHYHSKRQKIEILPDTNDLIPAFVMNSNITTVTQLAEEWTLIVKRTKKWGLGWIKNQLDFQIYTSRKVIIDFIEQLLPELSEDNSNKPIIEVDEDYIYDIVKVFDQYMLRKEMGLNDLVRKIEANPIYSKKEFLRILTRRKTTRS